MERWGCDARIEVTESGEEEWVDAADLAVILGDEPHTEEWWACPRRPVRDDPRTFATLSKLWAIREKGFMPYDGTYMDQPNVLIECWDTIDRAIAEARAMDDKRRELSGGR